jgi:hypothetical protein
MAIKNVPQISGPGYGGTIYGLSLSVGYSKEPSKCTISIVSPNGNYNPPTVGRTDTVQVSFGNFRFIGIPWSWTINESAAEKTLQVELIDGSVILDRYYVLLWKKGFFNNKGRPRGLKKRFDLTNVEYLIPTFNSRGTLYFKKDNLGIEEIVGTSNEARGKSGNVIYVGKEEFKDSECTVPGTFYTLDQLKGESPVPIDIQVPQDYRGTHEGTLREVISQWCNEAGYDFYWDFSSNQIKYYKSVDGIDSLTNISPSSNSTIIEKSETVSAEGTFAQVGFAYIIHPKEPVKSLLGNAKFSITVGINPYSIGYFFNKNGTVSKVTDRENWGSRTSSQMLTAGFLGYINQNLRTIWALYEGFFFACGYDTATSQKLEASQKTSAINALKAAGYEENIAALEKLDAKGLSNYDFFYADFDEGWLNTFQEIEQQAIQFLGKYYQHAGKSGKFFYCSKSSVIEIQVTVQPEAQFVEELTEENDFRGRKLFIRQGTMSHDQQSAAEAIGLNEQLIGKIESLQPWHYEFVNGPLQGIQTERNVLAIVPKKELVEKILPRFSIEPASGITNERETILSDLISQAQDDVENNCAPFDDAYKKGSCQSAREKAEEQARNKKIPKQKPEKQLVDGLFNRSAKGVNINLGSGRLRLAGPSDSSYQVIYNYTINVNILQQGDIETIKWEGNGVTANNVARLEVIEDNLTDPTFDDFGNPRNQTLPKAVNITNSTPQRTIKYVFAGEPNGVTMSPSSGLSGLEVSLSDDGFKSTVTFATKPKQRTRVDSFVRKVNSQINRSSINAT